MKVSWWASGLSLIVVGAGIAAGCGGGSPLALTPDIEAPLRSTGPTGITARIDYDPATGEVGVTNMEEGGTRAAFGGSAVKVTQAVVSEIAGQTSNVRVLELTIDNRSGIFLNEPRLLLQTALNRAVAKTLAGTGANGSTDGAASAAQVGQPLGVWQDTDGTIFVTQANSGAVRRIKNGVVTTISSGFSRPIGIVGETNGDFIYVADQSAHRILRLRKDGVQGAVIAGNTAGDVDGAGASARFNNPIGLTMDNTGALYVADFSNNKLKRITNPSTAPVVTTVGTVTAPYGVAYRAYEGKPTVAVTSHTTGNVILYDIFGNTTRTIRTLTPNITGIAALEGRIVVAGQTANNLTIMRLPQGANPFRDTSWTTELVLGSTAGFGNGAFPQFNGPLLLGSGEADELLVADTNNHRLRNVELGSLLPGNSGQAVSITNPDFRLPREVAGYRLGPFQPNTFRTLRVFFSIPFPAAMSFYVTVDSSTDGQIPLDSSSNAASDNVVVRLIAGDPERTGYADGQGASALIDISSTFSSADCFPNGELIFKTGNRIRLARKSGEVVTILNPRGNASAISGNGQVTAPPTSGIIATDSNDVFFILGSTAIYRVSRGFGDRYRAENWSFTRIAGDSGSGDVLGDGTIARFANLYSGYWDANAGALIVADGSNSKIKRVTFIGGDPNTPANWEASEIAGSTPGFADGSSPLFNIPIDVKPAPNGGYYVLDYDNQRIRLVTPSGFTTTIAGTGVNSQTDGNPGTLALPLWADVDSSGILYFVEQNQLSLRTYRPGGLSTVLKWTPGTPAEGVGSQFKANFPTFPQLAVDPTSGDVWLVGSSALYLVQRIVR
ncbi:MAG TPA: hypothetical protein PLB31_01735 [Fimbriimonadaceae bacterium]|nr:hypothetical protein [Armatimonadota bacterium]HCM74072.1 hypothetical protein [Armatimonadota bacterium]HRD31486.1 hypothetical protein [Fimbriimonadaceae bacterium]HRE94343.1 hypothetical protein [Fimbriimonadaceae bacterium]HRI73175.1 hypothetical protein [Fimbriimonadaceae bacterium]